MLTSQIPGYERAIARAARLEDGWRERAFVELDQTICGLLVRPLTLRIWLELVALNSPLLCGGPVGPMDLALFLWRISPEFSRRDHEARRAFLAAIAPRDFAQLVRGAQRYVQRMITDRPPSSGGPSAASDTSFAASIVHRLATAYHWDEDRILDLAMPRLFQYLREIARERDPKLPKFNPLRNRLTKTIRARARAAAEAAARNQAMCSHGPVGRPAQDEANR